MDQLTDECMNDNTDEWTGEHTEELTDGCTDVQTDVWTSPPPSPSEKNAIEISFNLSIATLNLV